MRVDREALRRWTSGFASRCVDLLYPPECAWCELPTNDAQRFCETCRDIFLSDYYRCQKCATPLPRVLPNFECFRCREAKWRFSRVIALGPYRGELRRAVILMKKSRFEPLRRAMGELLAGKILDEFPNIRGNSIEASRHDLLAQDVNASTPNLIVPVPNYWSHGFSSAADTAGLLAEAVARKIGLPVSSGIVRRIRKTAKQGMLSWAERRQNVRSAFKILVAAKLKASHVLLVDDVLTSGATAAELTKLMLGAGAAEVSVVVAARGTGVKDTSEKRPKSA